jgi:hypothetical protein
MESLAICRSLHADALRYRCIDIDGAYATDQLKVMENASWEISVISLAAFSASQTA